MAASTDARRGHGVGPVTKCRSIRFDPTTTDPHCFLRPNATGRPLLVKSIRQSRTTNRSRHERRSNRDGYADSFHLDNTGKGDYFMAQAQTISKEAPAASLVILNEVTNLARGRPEHRLPRKTIFFATVVTGSDTILFESVEADLRVCISADTEVCFYAGGRARLLFEPDPCYRRSANAVSRSIFALWATWRSFSQSTVR